MSASAFQSGSDALGVFARVSIDPKVFSEIAILKAVYWFTDQHYIFVTKNLDTGLFEIEFRLKQGDSLDKLKAVCYEFWNNVLDQEVRQKVLSETTEIRDTLIKKAFFDARALLPKSAISDESRLPQSGQSYNDDPVRAGRHE